MVMDLRKCPKCRELVNPQSVCCPRCGVIFREYRIKRLIFWAAVLIIVGYAFHERIAHWGPIARLMTHH